VSGTAVDAGRTTTVPAWRRALAGPWIATAVIAVAGLALRALVPPLLRWGNQHDDFAQVSVAAALVRGEWLGEWGAQGVPHITLAKGPGYPLFLAAIHPTGLPPQLAAYAIYLAGCLLLARTFARRLGPWWSVGLFGVLAFNPIVFSSAFSIVYRDALNTALAPLALGLGLDLARRVTRRGRWHATGWSVLVAEVLLLGLTFGWVAITRADIVWILFGTAGAFVVGLLPSLRRLGRRGWLTVVAGTLVVGVAAAAVPAAVAEKNEREYGVDLVDDYSDGTFATAVTLWSSVVVPDTEHFENVSRAQRAAVYAVSPTAASIADDLEDPDSVWIDRNCTWHEDLEDVDRPCDDYGSYFTWALRDASVRTGGVDSAQELQDFFGRITTEIQAACDAGALTCGMRGLSADVPPLDRMPVRVAIANLVGTVHGALTFNEARGQIQQAPADGADLATWETAVNGTGTVLSALETGQQPEAFGQSSVVDVLTLVYATLAVPALLLAVGALFLRRTWSGTVGRTAVVVVCAWLGNLAIVAVFYAGTNRAPGSKMPLYTMSSQSYLIVGLALAATVALQAALGRLRRTLAPVPGAHAGTGAGATPAPHPRDDDAATAAPTRTDGPGTA
jgi:hypothetical protein